jgi:cytidylate kinase
MTPHTYLEHGLTILKARLEASASAFQSASFRSIHPFITLSREVCAGATTLGRALVPKLNAEFSEPGQDWILLDKDLLGYALARHELPAQLARYLPEDRLSAIDTAIGEIVGLHPSIWELEQQVAQTIVQLAQEGRFIFVGRAAHLLTRSLPGGLHVRLVAPKEARIRRLAAQQGCDAEQAAAQVERTDQARRKFVKSHFGREIDDPHTYDLIINTDRTSSGAVVALVLEGLRDQVRRAQDGAADRALHPADSEPEHAVWTIYD